MAVLYYSVHFSLMILLLCAKANDQKSWACRQAGDHLYGKWLFTWLSLVMSLILSYFVLSFFPRDVLDEIWD